MVRRGSTVRVRQRAFKKKPANRPHVKADSLEFLAGEVV
jgi:hypothetical protein